MLPVLLNGFFSAAISAANLSHTFFSIINISGVPVILPVIGQCPELGGNTQQFNGFTQKLQVMHFYDGYAYLKFSQIVIFFKVRW